MSAAQFPALDDLVNNLGGLLHGKVVVDATNALIRSASSSCAAKKRRFALRIRAAERRAEVPKT